ncbi:9552_t:CDS:1, partial [Funneliformis geosporum]
SKTSDKSKFNKSGEGGNITLNCLIFDEKVNDIFDVTIFNAYNNRVSSLVKAIKTCHPDRFQDIDSTSLDLYKIGSGRYLVALQSTSHKIVVQLK